MKEIIKLLEALKEESLRIEKKYGTSKNLSKGLEEAIKLVEKEAKKDPTH